jgi:hypothetical protein
MILPRRILRHMRKIFRQYRLAKVTKELIYETDRVNHINDGYIFPRYTLVPSTDIKRSYVRRYKASSELVDNICKDALANEYIENDDRGGISDFMTPLVRLTQKGDDLLDTMPIIPIGLFAAWLGKYQFLGGISIGGVITGIVAIFKHYLPWFSHMLHW